MLSNIIITVDSREQNRKRIGSIEMWGAQHNAVVEHHKLERCDYSLEGNFNNHEINLGIEAKSLSQFCSEDKKDIKRKLAESYDYYTEVAFFIETGNYEYANIDGKKIIQIRAGPEFINGCSLAEFEGTLETLQASGIHVRQLRSEFQFPDSIHNLLTYITNEHEPVAIKGKSYPDVYKRVLMGIQGIGIQSAKKLIESYPNLFWLCSAAEESYKGILGNKTGKNLYEFIRNHELETKEWKTGYHLDGTKLNNPCHKNCGDANAYECKGNICKLHPDNDISDKIKSAIIDFLKQYPEGKTAEEICTYFNLGMGDKDKEKLLEHIKELAWNNKITNNATGLFVLSQSPSTEQERPENIISQEAWKQPISKLGTLGILLSNGVEVTKSDPITQGIISNHTGTVLIPPPLKIPDDTQGKTTIPLNSPEVQAKDLTKQKKSPLFSSDIIPSQPLPAITTNETIISSISEADELFGKAHPDWIAEKTPGKMNLQGRLCVFLETPRTMQDCVDEFCKDNEFQKGTVFEHVKRMERDNIVTQFDNKTFVMRMKKP